ncbi:SET domain-containing protein [Haloferula sp.]|uniref:SET domain-containing protein n=1 Tax=Haloferula sp. TaxID=2497595 RepID=UPI003C76E548
MGKQSRKIKEEARLRRKLTKLWNRGQSEYCEVRGSAIHGRGVYATQDIPAETKVIEYIGELIDKEESEKRAWAQHAVAEETGDAAVYIFTLNKRWDIDGNVPWNTARLINHSCAPNCEAWIEGKKIFIHSLRDIKKGEELGFDYGFDIECYEDHPCRCGSKECVGYIVSREQWDQLERKKRAAAKKARAKEEKKKGAA